MKIIDPIFNQTGIQHVKYNRAVSFDNDSHLGLFVDILYLFFR